GELPSLSLSPSRCRTKRNGLWLPTTRVSFCPCSPSAAFVLRARHSSRRIGAWRRQYPPRRGAQLALHGNSAAAHLPPDREVGSHRIVCRRARWKCTPLLPNCRTRNRNRLIQTE